MQTIDLVPEPHVVLLWRDDHHKLVGLEPKVALVAPRPLPPGSTERLSPASISKPVKAVLTILAATTQQPDPDPELIGLTVAEIRRLLNAFVLTEPLPPEHLLRWSIWRRTSQARARRSHYQRRQAK